VSTLAEIEAAIPTLSAAELEELERIVRQQRAKQTSTAGAVPENLWSGARERLRRIWGERVLSDAEVEEMRAFEDED
jgi:hypothetical protein